MIIIFLYLLLPSLILSFNISPTPNIRIYKPTPKTHKPQNRSSYFGYSINLRKESIMIGAPRAQSTLDSQRKIQETGVVFKCKLSDSVCMPFNFDKNGNAEVESADHAYNSEKKDFQMLGASMDGFETELSPIVVCAPKWKTDAESHYMLHGTCYWTENSIKAQPIRTLSINPLKVSISTRQSHINPFDSKKNNYEHIFGESGFSVHITPDSKEIIIGCPGIWNWKGSVIRHKLQHSVGSNRRLSINSSSDDVLDPYSDIGEDSYFGYAVSSAFFMGKRSSQINYIASAPRANKQTGSVFLFDIEDSNSKKKIKVFNTFTGNQMGEYFGYSLLTEDFNGDGLPDIAISGPFYSKTKYYENGAVYIFINRGNVRY